MISIALNPLTDMELEAIDQSKRGSEKYLCGAERAIDTHTIQEKIQRDHRECKCSIVGDVFHGSI